MHSIFFGVIPLLASTVILEPAHADKPGYAQALITHRQPTQVSRDNLNGVDQTYRDEDALTKKIEQDKIRLDRLIEICPSC